MSPMQIYARQIRQMILNLQPLDPQTDSESTLRIEHGQIFAQTLLHPDFRPTIPDLSTSRRIIDRNGHTRPIYRPLLSYALLQTLSIRSLPLPPWVHQMHQQIKPFAWPTDALPAGLAEPAALACWNALSMQVARLDSAHPTFNQLFARQQPNGSFLIARPSDSPDMRWYHELLILHAAASYASLTQNPPAIAAVKRNALFHLEESQPDHATSQPWGLFAFIQTPQARPLADQLLHTLQTLHPQGITGIAAILLADALWSIQQTPDPRS